MCRLLKVSASGYYAWRKRPESARAERDRELMPRIRQIHKASRGVYGSPRVHAELVAEGVCIGRHKVAKLMRSARLRGCPKRRYRTTTQQEPSHAVAKNLLKRNFTADGPNQRWAGDITYISTRQGWLYLAVVMDLFSRRVIGWSMSRWMSRHLVVDALRMAVEARRPEGPLIHHSDRGGQYSSDDFRNDVCGALAINIGAANVWFGHAAGIKSTAPTQTWADQGCFPTEAECKAWLHRRFSGSKTNSVTSCRQGAPSWSIR